MGGLIMKIGKNTPSYNANKPLMILVVLILVLMTACSGGSTETSGSAQDKATGSSSNASSNPSSESEKLPSFEISISNFQPDKHSLNQDVMMPLAESLKKETNSRINATVFSGGALGKPGEHFNMAATGVADIALVIQGYTPGKFPATSVGELPFIVPYGASTAENITKVLWDLHEKFPQIAEDHKGTKILALFNGDPANLIMKDKEIKSLDDLKGLKIRTPSPSASELIEALGATPVAIPMPGVYDALQKGVVDGALSTMSTLTQFKLDEVAKYVIDSKIYGTTFALVMNDNSYEKFQGEDRKLLESLTGRELSLTASRGFDREAQKAKEAAIKKGVQVRDLTPEEIEKLNQLVKPIIDKWIKSMEEKGIPGSELYKEAILLGEKYSK
jgi:TRAP-type C4-dicarboxylate transport system substrate-binding protein